MKYYLLLSFIWLGYTVLAQSDCSTCYDPNLSCYDTPSCTLQRTEGVIDTTPVNCNDGIDNDGDGLTDCEEPTCDCAAVEICNDGIDNDGDGLIDCQDQDDCGASTSCENDCGDGIDNDGDGFYDYYDGDCLSTPDNPNNYIGVQSSCSVAPSGSGFHMQIADESANQTSAAFDMPMVADIDNDGTPEVITTNAQTGGIYILDGADLSIVEYQSTHGSNTFGYPAVGDVDGDGEKFF